jgi:hypothetical protein
MTSRLRNLADDCADARALAWFWVQVLGWNVSSTTGESPTARGGW